MRPIVLALLASTPCLGFVGACSSTGSPADASTADVVDANADDGAIDAGSPQCEVAEAGSLDPAALPAFGNFAGFAVGDVCLGGAFAVAQRLTNEDGGVQTLLEITAGEFGDPATYERFQTPSDPGITGSLSVLVGLPAAPGDYTNLQASCGNVSLCAMYPIPNVDCGDGGTTTCPQGCAFADGDSGACEPVVPETCYRSTNADDCIGNAAPPRGDWRVTLTSVTAFDSDAGTGEFVVHGAFRGHLPGDDGGTVTLTLGF